MKPFEFSLKRMQNYKEQVLNREKNTLGRLQQNKNSIEQHISELKAYRSAKSLEMQHKQLSGMSAYELSAFRFLLKNTHLQLEGLKIELERAEIEVERQLKVVIAATQELSGLEKLHDKQLEQYKLEEAKATELEIAEHIVSTLARGVEKAQDGLQ